MKKEPVILFHGIGGSGYQWLLNSVHGKAANWTMNRNDKVFQHLDDSLAIKLSNYGYDVFLPNLRGNQYSNGHEYLDHKYDTEYWNFSIDEIIKYDTHTVIDKVLEITKYEKTNCVGISMGGMILYGLPSGRPEYNQKINKITTIASNIIFPNSAIATIGPIKYKKYLLDAIIKYFETFFIQGKFKK